MVLSTKPAESSSSELAILMSGGIVEAIVKHRGGVSLRGSVLRGMGSEMYSSNFRHVVRPVRERDMMLVKTLWYTAQTHVVYELLFNSVGESALNIEKEGCCYFTLPPGVRNLVQDQ